MSHASPNLSEPPAPIGRGRLAIRRLKRRDAAAFERHLLALDPECRRLRFGHAVNDAFVRAYAERAQQSGAEIIGAFVDGELRGAGELHPGASRHHPAEVAFSVEQGYRRCGIGRRLLKQLIVRAQNEGIGRLVMVCLAENLAMQRLARPFGHLIQTAPTEVEAVILTTGPTPFSMLREVFSDLPAPFPARTKRPDVRATPA